MLSSSSSSSSSTSSTAPRRIPSRREPASPLRELEDYFGLKQLVKTLPTTPEEELVDYPSSISSGPFPTTKRKSGDNRRMAAFLDRTASAMEGGKSLAMVLPPRVGGAADEEGDDGVTFLEALSYEEKGRSSPPRSSSPFPTAPTVASGAAEGAAAESVDRPPSPTRSAAKRQRVIRELLDTEQSHAVDLAVVRDIYLARARGAHLSQIADHAMGSGLGLHRSTDDRRKRSSLSSAPPDFRLGQALMSDADIETIFLNLEEVAALAQDFAAALTEASGSGQPDAQDDTIGAVFLDMLHRIQEASSRYCVRHHRAILRLQELTPTLRTYLSECATLADGRTSAWDLASLLIKPVQRCLKYPLLLDQLLAETPEDHPDRPQLQQAYAEMLLVAEHINESKRRTDLVSRYVSKDKNAQRRDSSRSVSDSLSKKLRRTSQRTRNAFESSGQHNATPQNDDVVFDALVALLHTTRTGAQRFCQEMREWTENTRSALEAQVRLVEGWIEMYAPLVGERAAAESHERLVVFLDDVLLPTINNAWASLDDEVRSSLFVKAEHLLSLFDNPMRVIAKRHDKALDHGRYLAKKQPVDKRGSEEYLLLTAQLSEELPRFLGSVSRYFNILVSHFASAQAAYHEALHERWDAYANRWIVRIPPGSPKTIQTAFEEEHQPFAVMMQMLATGLGVTASNGAQDAGPPTQRPLRRESHWSSASENSGHALSMISTPRSSITSVSSAGESVPLAKQASDQTEQATPLAASPASSLTAVDSVRYASHRRPSRDGGHDAASLRSRYLSQYSIVLPNEYAEDGSDGIVVPLYTAEAVNASRSSSFRSGFPILSFDVGERLEVEYEEPDRAEGGSGWLLGRKPTDRKEIGWARTEDFVLLEDTEGEGEEA
ncbi:hypothetical protein JCM8202v2_003575 [Rhodotorula sphaerocarpa]